MFIRRHNQISQSATPAHENGAAATVTDADFETFASGAYSV